MKKNDVHGGNIWQSAGKQHIPPESILDFSVNLNPYISKKKILHALSKSLYNVSYYPDPEYTSLRKTISDYLGISPESILPGNGATALIYLIPQVFNPENSCIIVPAFSEYERAVNIYGGKISFLQTDPEKKFVPSIKSILKINPQLIYICNPNNPTGSLLFKDKLKEIISVCKKKDILVVIDEAFIEFIERSEDFSFIREATVEKNLIVIRSLTKIFSIPGLRTGYAVTSPENIKRLKKNQHPWGINGFVGDTMVELMKDIGFIKDSVIEINKQKNFLVSELNSLKVFKVFKSYANFLLIRIENGMNSLFFYNKLEFQGILIRDCSTILGLNNRYFRIAVNTESENKRLIATIREVIKDGS